MFPTGEQIEISRDDQTAVAVEVGGGLRQYRAGGRPVLDGYDALEICDGDRGHLLVPWPNRLRDGSYDWAGRRLQLPLSEPERGNAIHGLARWTRWQVIERSAARAILGLDLPARLGYPFMLRLRVEYALEAEGLVVSQSATNVGTEACPYGAGAHPYLLPDTDNLDPAKLQVPAQSRLIVDERQIPVGIAPVEGTPFDFRAPRLIDGIELDTAYTDFDRGGDGLASVRLEAPAGRGVKLWVDASIAYLMVFTGDTLDQPRRRRSLAVEPMTCAPNAFQSGEGLRILQPGETFRCTWGITPW